MNMIKDELLLLHQLHTKMIVKVFFVLTLILSIPYIIAYRNMPLSEFQAMTNGNNVTSYYIWFVVIMSFVIITKIIISPDLYYKKEEVLKIFSYYLYLIIVSFCLVLTYQLLIHLFLPINIMDTIKILASIVLFNVIYYFILMTSIMTIKNIVNKDSITFPLYCLFIWGMFISPVIKAYNKENLFTNMITLFDLNALFGKLYLFITSSIFHLPFVYYGKYTEFFFQYISLNNIERSGYNIYFHKSIEYPYLLLMLIITGVMLAFVLTIIRNKKLYTR